MNESFDVVVVGAGLAGLSAGATAALGASTLIFDGHHPGGRASTDERGAYRFNRGPHALYRGGEAQAVLARLGVSTPGAIPPAEGARGRLGDIVDVLPATAATLLPNPAAPDNASARSGGGVNDPLAVNPALAAAIAAYSLGGAQAAIQIRPAAAPPRTDRAQEVKPVQPIDSASDAPPS